MGKLSALPVIALTAAVGLIIPLACTLAREGTSDGTGGEGGTGSGGATSSGGGETGGGGATSSGGGTGTAANGIPCDGGSECLSGICAQGVCCNSDCNGVCESCSSALTSATNGSCMVIPVGGDKGACPAATTAQMCDGVGSCLQCGQSPLSSSGSPNVINCPDFDVPEACPSLITCPDGQACSVNCTGDDSCKGKTINCPRDADCTVLCTGDNDACDAAIINCPDLHPCKIVCGGGGDHHCRDLTVECPIAGICSIDCAVDNNTCENAILHCGYNSCSAVQCLNSNKEPIFEAPGEGTNTKPAPPSGNPPCPKDGCP